MAHATSIYIVAKVIIIKLWSISSHIAWSASYDIASSSLIASSEILSHIISLDIIASMIHIITSSHWGSLGDFFGSSQHSHVVHVVPSY